MEEQDKKDFHWTTEGKSYVIRNVPYYKETEECEESYGLSVTIAMAALKDLMFEEKIPNDVDYEDFTNIIF